ncbi:MAG: Lipopolysaccharide export system ATP-binding protein LptB [Alphaproteobacteria bacterium MarineAlpha5_Bin11]|nr:LPS export ABC transporter ATP-binding protein [Pelagibacteraceae bacterium]PPR43239.1 MAG: Lipopolysaccharide export system ATP-binding protein LptB [Alphaproteobacteria bacterium MarineAlpha5_Bin11]PPR52166.1 MAG: Lipopolysaccharide export system ATP-binding protein LptB [Alphaproteobacteria bacterium MarineAlpha5_Bin10]|tara:strand:- start:12736 stop:13488 length:753 start_codon:yes stop_codon:yes gene_type:complete
MFKLLNEGLSLNKISKSINKKPIIRNITLNVRKSQIIGLLGPNGAGKTTAFHILVGLLKADSGDVLLDGKKITDIPIFERGSMGIGYLPQDTSIFRGMNVEDNIYSILELSENNKSIRRIKLENLLNEFDISHLRKSRAIVLSGGEKRRLEIARTLAANPKYLLMDEPLTGIDPISIDDIKIIITKLKQKNIGVIITDHNVRETLNIVDIVYMVNEGNIICSGKPEDVIRNKIVKSSYLGESFKFEKNKK